MQIAVVNQKTKSIPSRCFEAIGGSQGIEQCDERRRRPEQDAQPQQLENRAPTHGDPRLVNSDQRREPYRGARFPPFQPPKRREGGLSPSPSGLLVGGRTTPS